MIMSYTEQEKQEALALYDELGSISKVINKLGFPSRQNMYTWIRNRNVEQEKRKKADCSDPPEHRRHPSLETKLNILHRCFELGEDILSVSEETGYSRTSIYLWRRKYLAGGSVSLMSKQKHLPRGELVPVESQSDTNQTELLAKIKELELENDILRETINVLKKDQGIDWLKLKNREKTMIVDALKNKYSLSLLFRNLDLSKSSYYYHKQISKLPNKYEALQEKIIDIFYENRAVYGYRRVHALLKRENIRISEKIVRSIMKENNLIVKVKKTQKYNSYQGEITPAPENIIERNFHAERPNEKMLTDITEFSIPAGKIYLSSIIDCFDGMVPTWRIGTSPNAELVNEMLDEYHDYLKEETPLIHSDRGVHYRWPGWIKRMKEYGFTRSMSRKGFSCDNAACEGFFGHLKTEMFYGKSWLKVSIEEFIKILNEYIIWYNTKRIKQTLNYMSPYEYRQSLDLL